MTLSNFFIKVAKKKIKKAKLDALVAAATAGHRSEQETLDDEDQEIRQEDKITMAAGSNSKIAFPLHNHKHTLEPSASRDMGQQCGFAGVTMSSIIKAKFKPIDVDKEEESKSKPIEVNDIEMESEPNDRSIPIESVTSAWHSLGYQEAHLGAVPRGQVRK